MVYQWLKNNLFLHDLPKNCLLCEQLLPLEAIKPDSSSLYINPELLTPRTHTTLLCSGCFEKLPRINSSCFRCAIGIPEFASMPENPTLICGACIANNPLQYRAISPLAYLFPVPELISRMKFRRDLSYLGLLAMVFTQHTQACYRNDRLPECIIPVPLHPNREFVRGFNQAELLAHQVGKSLHIPCDTSVLKRTRNTPSQMQLSIPERERNMKKAFALARTSRPVHYQHVTIFDDVFTTGATTQSMARVLLNAGCQRVDIWSIARTPKPE